jgi:DNA polymerase/3'-5' exonuclease PolX
MIAAPKPKFPRALAVAVAKQICDAIWPSVHRMIVAGSLRRRKESVGDVEILYIPRFATLPRADDLFAPPEEVNLADQTIDSLIRDAIITPRRNVAGAVTWGDKNKLALHIESSVPVDLFATTEASWFNYLVCRTGSAANNTRIASAAQFRKWKWNPYGEGFTDQEGNTVAVTCEQDAFRLVGLPYLEPWQR